MSLLHSPQRDAPAVTPVEGDLLLGPGTEFEGRITFKGTVRIDARVKGAIATDGVLIVGTHARLDADITCGTLIVHGEVNGNIRASGVVELRRTARVCGDVDTPALSTEPGAFVQGAVRMAPGAGRPATASGDAPSPRLAPATLAS